MSMYSSARSQAGGGKGKNHTHFVQVSHSRVTVIRHTASVMQWLPAECEV